MTAEKLKNVNSPKRKLDPTWLFALCGVLFAVLAFLLLSKQEQDLAVKDFAGTFTPQSQQFSLRLQQELELAGMLRSVSQPRDAEPGALATVLPLLAQQYPAALMLASYASTETDPVVRWLQPDAAALQSQLLGLLDQSVSGQQPESHLVTSSQGVLLINSAKRKSGFLVTVSRLQILLEQSGLMDLPEGVSFELGLSNQPSLLTSETPVTEPVAVTRVEIPLRDETLQLTLYASQSYLGYTGSWLPAMILLTGLLLAFFYAAFQKRQSQVFNSLRQQRDQLSIQLEASLVTDPITGLANHTRFEQVLESEIGRAVREFSPLSLMLVKVDGLSDYRDEFGQGQQEKLLSKLGTVLAGCISRPGDMLAHLSVDTFAFVLPSTNENAPALAERCCERVLSAAIPHAAIQPSGYVTVSIGLVTLQPSDRLNFDRLMALAGEQLQLAEAKGGSHYEAYVEAVDEPELGFGI